MIVEHVEAFAGLIDAVANVTVYADEPVPNTPTFPYVAVYGNQGVPVEATFDSQSTTVPFTFQTTCVGKTQGQLRALADRVQAALVDVRPTVAGRSCSQLTKVASQPVRLDTSVTPPVFIAVDVWAFTSVPA